MADKFQGRSCHPIEQVDIPWPVFVAHKRKSTNSAAISVTLTDLTPEAISDFLRSFTGHPNSPDKGSRNGDPESAEWRKSQKDILRESFLRFHPDKFEGRLMKYVKEEERPVVKEGLAHVVRVLNEMMISDPRPG